MKDALRQHLLQNYSEQELVRWFDPLDLKLDEFHHTLEISFPHAYFARWFEVTVRDRFETLLRSFFKRSWIIYYRDNNKSTNNSCPTPIPRNIAFPFDAQFTFDSFIVNNRNYFPLASAREVAKQTDKLLNPFVVCGAIGVGKSHILRAIANEISKQFDSTRIMHTSMQDLHEFYNIKFNRDKFKARAFILEHDFLLVDDFHHINNIIEFQPEIVSIFNYFYKKKQMVFTCQDIIATCDYLDPVLRSCFEWGLIVTLKQPDLEIRVAYVQDRCRSHKLRLNKEQILTLAQRFQSFRYLEGILIKLLAYRKLVHKDFDQKKLDTFWRIMKNYQ